MILFSRVFGYKLYTLRNEKPGYTIRYCEFLKWMTGVRYYTNHVTFQTEHLLIGTKIENSLLQCKHW